MSKLVDGCVPPHTNCPYKDKCEIAIGGSCKHTGERHSVPFSCAVARGFEICEKYELKD